MSFLVPIPRLRTSAFIVQAQGSSNAQAASNVLAAQVFARSSLGALRKMPAARLVQPDMTPSLHDLWYSLRACLACSHPCLDRRRLLDSPSPLTGTARDHQGGRKTQSVRHGPPIVETELRPNCHRHESDRRATPAWGIWVLTAWCTRESTLGSELITALLLRIDQLKVPNEALAKNTIFDIEDILDG